MDYSFVREEFNKDHSTNYVLSIQLDPDGFSFYISHKDSINKPLYFLIRRFEKSGVESLIKEVMDFKEYDKCIFHKTIIIYHTEKFCLIPYELYNPDIQADYLKLAHPLSGKESIYSSDIQKIGIKAVFCLPEELNNQINIKFPNAIILHSSYTALNYGIQKSEKNCVINLYGSSISIAVFDRKELKFFNVFSVLDENDLVYYALNALKSCNLKAAETVFYFSGSLKGDSFKNILQSEYISKPVYYNPDLQEINTPDFPATMLFNHLEALHCEL